MRVLGGNDGALLEKTATKTETKRSVQQRCSVRSIYCHNDINFSTINQSDLIYSIVKQQNVELKVKNVKCVTQKFLGFFHQHSLKTGSIQQKVRNSVALSTSRSISQQYHRCGHQKCSMWVSAISGWLKIGARRSRYIQLRIRTFQYFKLNSKLDGLLGHLKYAAKINVVCLLSDLWWKILRTHAVDLFILQGKIHCGRKTNCWLQGTTWNILKQWLLQ